MRGRLLLFFCCCLTIFSRSVLAAAQESRDVAPPQFLASAIERLRGDFLEAMPLTELPYLPRRLICTSAEVDSLGRVKKPLSSNVSEVRANEEGQWVWKRSAHTAREGEQVQERLLSDPGEVADALGPSGCLPPCESSDALKRELLSLITFEYSGRAELNARPSLVYSFSMGEPADNASFLAKRLEGTEGKLWFDEASHALIRVQGRYSKTLHLVRGLFVGSSIEKGSHWEWEMRPVEGKAVWLRNAWQVSFKQGRNRFLRHECRFEEYFEAFSER